MASGDPSGPIMAFLRRTYPSPAVDPTWVSECIAALIEDGQSPTLELVHEQYLYSDLTSSTLPCTALSDIDPRSSSMLFTHTPLLVQVHTINEIGASAFSLRTALEQRRDVISGATRIRTMDDEDDAEVAGEQQKVPPYPRSMLKLDISDGHIAVRAIEYARIGDLVLGETPLGTKLLLRNVKCLRGTLLLTSLNCTVLGGAIDALEAAQPEAFVASLQERLDRARETGTGDTASRRRITLPRKPPAQRAQDLPPAPLSSAPFSSAPAAEMTPRAYSTITQPPATGQQTPDRSGTTCARASSGTSTGGSRPTDAGRAARLAAIQAALGQENLAQSSRTSYGSKGAKKEDVDDETDFDDSFIRHVEELEARATKPKRRRGDVSAESVGRNNEWGDEVEVIEISD